MLNLRFRERNPVARRGAGNRSGFPSKPGGYFYQNPAENASGDNKPPISRYPGLWEVPLYNFIAPPDDACARIGIPAGLRDRLKKVNDYFDTAKGEITGMDWNLWNEFNMTPAEFVATLKYSLDRHLAGSRCPMTVGIHSELYTGHGGAKGGGSNITERAAALEEFFAYALGKPEVRLVNTRELLAWLRDPVPLGTRSGS